ncbi:MAG: lipid-binding SYLF domain-containing protein [Firmicutes bacterium]|nr:lipid-binding SYLF domain-containing protein [Bacillota bacterium]
MYRKSIVVLLLIAVLTTPAMAKTPNELIEEAVLVLREIAEQPDAEPMANLLKNAYGVAIFPSVIKAGIGLGGRYGEGVILQRDPKTNSWYGPYFVNMKGISYGFQIGLQSTALVLVIANERGMEGLKEGKITLGGSLSIAAGPIGRSAEAGTDLELKASMYSYSISRGAFAGASLEGAIIDNSTGSNLVFWQEELKPEEILKKKASSESIQPLIQELQTIVKKTHIG